MLQLIFTVCSIVQGANCHTLPPIPLQEGTSMMACLMASQFEGAKYIVAHPNHWIAKASCKPITYGLRANI